MESIVADAGDTIGSAVVHDSLGNKDLTGILDRVALGYFHLTIADDVVADAVDHKVGC